MIETRIHSRAEEIDVASWAYLNRGGSPFYDREWFVVFQDLIGVPLYLAAYEEGRLVGLLPGYLVSDPKTYLFHNPKDLLLCRNEIDFSSFLQRSRRGDQRPERQLFCRLARWAEPWIDAALFPAFAVMSPRGYVSDMLFEDETAAAALLEALETMCERRGIKSISLLAVEEKNRRLQAFLQRQGWLRQTIELGFDFEVRWKSMPEMVAQFVSDRRYEFRREIIAADERGVKMEFHGGAEFLRTHLDAILTLHEAHAQQVGDLLAGREMRPIFQALIAQFAGQIYTIAATCEGKLSGVVIGLRKGETLYPKFVGFDKQLDRDSAAYFRMNYFFQMQAAMAEGVGRIYFGSSDPQVKITRGCQPFRYYSYYAFRGSRATRQLGRFYLHRVNRYKETVYPHLCEMKVWKRTSKEM